MVFIRHLVRTFWISLKSALQLYIYFKLKAHKAKAIKAIANEGRALARIFARNVTQELSQVLKLAERNELDANEGMALAQIFCAKARPND